MTASVRVKFISSVIAVFSAIGFALPAVADPVHNITQATDHLTIQDGIDNAVAGDVINVDPGTFSENITLNKSITLNGANAGATGCGRVVGAPSPVTETVLTAPSGAILNLVGGCAGSTIDGFAFDGSSAASNGISSSSGPLDDLTIQNNWIGGTLGSGIFLNDSGIDVTVHQNELDGSAAGGGGYVHLDTDSFDGFYFTDNCVLNAASGTGFFVDGNHNIGMSTRAPLISGNVLDGNAVGMNLGTRAFEDGSIVNNTFDSNIYDGLQGGIQNTTISGNLLDSNGRYGIALTSFGSTDPTKGAQNCTLTGNTFTGNVTAGLLFSSSQLAGTISTNVANNNDFVGNTVGASYAGTEVIDVTCNWWGDLGGPDAPSSPNAAGDDISGTTPVFAPWLDGSIVGSPNCDQYPPVHNVTQNTYHGTIQGGVDGAVSGDLLDVPAGTYVEQILVDGKDLTIQGAGCGTSIIESPALLATQFTTSGPNKPIVTAINTASVVIDGFTIDGLGVGNANNRFEGVAFYNAGGAVLNCCIVNIDDTPQTGVQHGVGVWAFNNTGGPYALEVGNTTISGYQKNGMALSGDGLTVDVHDCTTIGSGDVAYIAQNGIQVSFGAGGSITDCSVSDMRYTPATTVSSGVLIYQGTSVDVDGVTLVDAQEAIYFLDTAGSVNNADISFVSSTPDYDGIFVANYTTPFAPSEKRANPSPASESYSGGGSSRRAPLAVSVTSSCITGAGVSGTTGFYGFSAGEPMTIDASGLTITGWDYGVVADGSALSLDIASSSISGNTTAGYDNSLSGASQDASLNWWGAADGPSGDGAGSGDAVVSVGGEVTFAPFLIDGTSSTSCAFTPGGNLVTPVPGPGPCVSTVDPCLPVAFDIARTDNADMRGFSVTFTLSSELELCAGLASITENTYLSSIGGTAFQKLDNGGGSYTVDGSILGLPCGATAASGTLFDIAVQASGGDGTGTITITEILFRDCANGPLPASAAAPVSITVDATPPVAVSNIAAAQVKTGNTAGQDTTGITVSFTAPGDATVQEVYGAGYGNYPEYDDAPGAGSVPAIPSYPPGAPWVLASTAVSPTTVHFDDRDFYYFVVFTKDACGNVSAVSNMTTGTLNYHLGDVTDGTTNGHGNNSVGTEDISHLGSNYGITLGVSDPLGYLDVGPTSDFSVDALPTTDNEVEFEDLMMFAINFGQVSRVPGTPTEAPVENPQIVLISDAVSPSAGSVLNARLVLQDHGRSVKGIHTQVDYDQSRLELVSVRQGGLLDEQAASVFFKDLPSENGVIVDTAVLGRELTFSGSGEVATLTFRVLSSGAVPVLADAALRGRDNLAAGRQPVVIASPQDNAPIATLDVPEHLELVGARPNPFRSSTDIVFRMPATSAVSVSVYDVSGRLVRSLVDRTLPAGEHRAVWDGRASDGQAVSSGIYFYTFRTDGHQETRRLIHLR